MLNVKIINSSFFIIYAINDRIHRHLAVINLTDQGDYGSRFENKKQYKIKLCFTFRTSLTTPAEGGSKC
jgi:hypothetical protein